MTKLSYDDRVRIGRGRRLLRALRSDTVTVQRADLLLALDEDAWPLEDAEAARARLREAIGR